LFIGRERLDQQGSQGAAGALFVELQFIEPGPARLLGQRGQHLACQRGSHEQAAFPMVDKIVYRKILSRSDPRCLFLINVQCDPIHEPVLCNGPQFSFSLKRISRLVIV
jgi:hypothetical protein